MNDRSINTWTFDPCRTFAMHSRQDSNKTDGTATSMPQSVLSQYDQIVINPCLCGGPDTLRPSLLVSRTLSRTLSRSSLPHRAEFLLADNICLPFPIDAEASSILTSTTASSSSVSTSSIQTFVTPPVASTRPDNEPARQRSIMLHRTSATVQRPPALPRPPPRPIRRVCLSKDKNCTCLYHQTLERSLGPIDIDEFCDEAASVDEEREKIVVASILEDLDQSFRSVRRGDPGEQKTRSPSASSLCSKRSKSSLASGETSTSSDTTEDPSWQVRVTVTRSRGVPGSRGVQQQEEEEKVKPSHEGSDDVVSLAESTSSRVTGPVLEECGAEVVEVGHEELSIIDEFILDELDLSRELMGYMEGTAAEEIDQYNTTDIRRWDSDREMDSIPGASSPGKSRGSSGRRSHASSFYPYSIPESAAEI
jgi:hypothetical protein